MLCIHVVAYKFCDEWFELKFKKEFTFHLTNSLEF